MWNRYHWLLTNDEEPKFYEYLQEADEFLLSSVPVIYIWFVTVTVLHYLFSRSVSLLRIMPLIWSRHSSSYHDSGSSSAQCDLCSPWTQHCHAWLPPGQPLSQMMNLDIAFQLMATPLSHSVALMSHHMRPSRMWHTSWALPTFSDLDWIFLFNSSQTELLTVSQTVIITSPGFFASMEYPNFTTSILSQTYFSLKTQKNKWIKLFPSLQSPDWVYGLLFRFL